MNEAGGKEEIESPICSSLPSLSAFLRLSLFSLSLLLFPSLSLTHLGHDNVFGQRLGDAQRDIVRRRDSGDRIALRAIGQLDLAGDVCGLGGLDLCILGLVLIHPKKRKVRKWK